MYFENSISAVKIRETILSLKREEPSAHSPRGKCSQKAKVQYSEHGLASQWFRDRTSMQGQ
ncbi:hypothetical protein GJAV_G00072470 [Gymnothorax javanicus]|nr:hypothetical protein GJAV_G00072470 [Gymnothorax javanicus]